MLSAAAIIGLTSLACLLGFSVYILRKLGAEEVAFVLAAVVAVGFAAALATAILG